MHRFFFQNIFKTEVLFIRELSIKRKSKGTEFRVFDMGDSNLSNFSTAGVKSSI